MYKKILIWLFLISGFIIASLFFPKTSFASRSITISSSTAALHGYDEMTVTISSMSGFTSGETIYIKGAFYKDGSTNYFGLTKNGDNWIKNSDSTTNQRQIQVGNWDQMLTLQSDFADSGYTSYGEGDYKVKIGFYYLTSGNNLSAINWSSNSLDVSISSPDPTPTPTSPPPTSTPVPTSTPKPTSTPIPKLTLTPKPDLTLEGASDSSQFASDSGVLGSSDSADGLVAGASEEKINGLGFNPFAVALIICGIIIFAVCGILLFRQWQKSRLIKNNENTHE